MTYLSLNPSFCQLLLLLLKSAAASCCHSASDTPSSWKRMNLPAFHSLFVKLRFDRTRSTDRFRSWPAVVPARRKGHSHAAACACAPYMLCLLHRMIVNSA
eukprot:GHRR01037823.1.p3 GENE.GHRR01037823.1~~GHRR01037823.1.p3  ORF type:complete len:101 (+),score=29.41 GHRR01037823.1:227-529(+)